MKKDFTFTKTNSCYKNGTFHVGRSDMWGNYCPETGEYYLAHNAYDPIPGEYVEVLASVHFVGARDDEWQEDTARGYSYEVVRELLQLGHLTAKTLETFLAMDGEVWWDQPDFFI